VATSSVYRSLACVSSFEVVLALAVFIYFGAGDFPMGNTKSSAVAAADLLVYMISSPRIISKMVCSDRGMLTSSVVKMAAFEDFF
jgi:hypothetical protein